MVDMVSRIKLLFLTQGADKAAKQTEKIGRAQTRLGQSSASAGRQFSSQAQGLGGLVTAYAGAAANIFAITMAFTALSRAAQATAAIEGTKTLAAVVGEQGDLIINKIREITMGQLSMAEASKAVNLALSAGFSSEQIEKLSTVALKASIALGRDLGDSFDRLIRGVAKIEPEILDELGIIVRLDEAVRKYAASIGKAASQLTTYERSQAFANAVGEQGIRKFEIIDTSIVTAAQSLNIMSARIKDLIQSFGALIATGIAPVVNFISGNFINTLSTAGLLGGLVFSKLGDVAGGALRNIATSAQNAGNSVTEALGFRARAATAGLMEEMSEAKGINLGYSGSIKEIDMGSKKAAMSLLMKARAGTITRTEMIKLDRIFRRNTGALTELAAAATFARTAVQKMGWGTKVAAVSFGILTKVVKGTALAMNILIGAVGKIFFVFSILQLLSSTIGKLVFGVDLFQEAGKDLKSWFEGLPASINAANRAQATFNAMLRETAGITAETTSKLDEMLKTQTKYVSSSRAAVRGKELFGIDLEDVLGFILPDVEQGPQAGAIKAYVEQVANSLQKRFSEMPTGDVIDMKGAMVMGWSPDAVKNLLQDPAAQLPIEIFDVRKVAESVVGPGMEFQIEDMISNAKNLFAKGSIDLGNAAAEDIRQMWIDMGRKFLEISLRKKWPDLDTQAIKVLLGVAFDPLVETLDDKRIQIKAAFKRFEEDFPGLSSRFMKFYEESIAGFTIRLPRQEDVTSALTGGMAKYDSALLNGMQNLNAEFLKSNPLAASLVTRFLEMRESLATTGQTSEDLTKKSDSLYKSLAKVVLELKTGDEDAKAFAQALVDAFGAADSFTGKAIDMAKAIARLSDTLKTEFSKELTAAGKAYRLVDLESGKFIKNAAQRENRRYDLLVAGLTIEKERQKIMAEGRRADAFLGEERMFMPAPLMTEEEKRHELTQRFMQSELDLAAQTNSILTGMYEQVLTALEKINKELKKQEDKENSILGILQTKIKIGKAQNVIQEETRKNKEADVALSLKGKKNAAAETLEAEKQIKLGQVEAYRLRTILNTVINLTEADDTRLALQKNRLRVFYNLDELTDRTTKKETISVEQAKQQIDYMLQMVDSQIELNNLAKDRLATNIAITAENKRQALGLKQDYASAFSDLVTEKDIQGMEIQELKIDVTEATQLLNLLDNNRQKDVDLLDKRIALQKEQNRIEFEMAERQRVLDKTKYDNEFALQVQEKANIDRQLAQGPGLTPFDAVTQEMIRVARLNQTIADEQTKTANEARIDALKLRKIDLQNTLDQGVALQTHGEDLGNILYAHAKDMAAILSREEIDKTKYLSNVDDEVKALAGDVNDAITRIDGVIGTINSQTEAQRILNEQSADAKVADIISNREIAKAKLEQSRTELANQIKLKALYLQDFEDRKILIEGEQEIKNEAADVEHNAALAALDLNILTAKQKRDAALAELEAAKKLNELLNNQFIRAIDDISGKLQGRFKEGIDSLMQAMNEGTLTMENFKEGFRDWLLNILGDIQQSLMDELITKPIQEFIKEGMGSLADLFKPAGEKGEEVESIQDVLRETQRQDLDILEKTKIFEEYNIQQVFVVNMPGEGFSGGGTKTAPLDGGLLEDSQKSQADSTEDLSAASNQASIDVGKLGVTAVATFASVYAATGDFKEAMIATFLAMFMQIAMMQAMAAWGGASGGYAGRGGTIQRFAAGGGVFQRDRIPALLEPGEFVIRKPMAKAIGGPALQRMNAHGQMPGGNVEVNLVNKGTPQKAEAKEKPKFDGKGMVIEIVLTDLKNNGPIKQAIRGGGRR